MNIIQRNFFRLLRAGTFQTEELIEPMSAWKWGQAFFWAKKLGVAPLLYDGVEACSDQFFMRLTDELRQQWQQEAEKAERRYHEACTDVAELLTTLGELQLRPILMEPWTTACLYPTPSRHHAGLVCIYFPFSTQGHKADEWARTNGSNADSPHRHVLQYKWKSLSVEHRHRMLQLSNKLNNLTLHHIIEQEWLSLKSSATMLSTLMEDAVGCMKGTSSALKPSNSVSSVPTSCAIRLKCSRSVHSCSLTKSTRSPCWRSSMPRSTTCQRHSPSLSMVLMMLTRATSRVSVGAMVSMRWPLMTTWLVPPSSHSSARFFRYSPGESLSSVVASITHSLGNIEE